MKCTNTMQVRLIIIEKLEEKFNPSILNVIDESHLHEGHVGARPEGETHFKGLGELRVKESNRLETIVSEIGSMGMNAEISGDDLIVKGGKLTGGKVNSHGDHRIAMSCAVAALVSAEPTVISGWEAVSTSYPDFAADLERLRK